MPLLSNQRIGLKLLQQCVEVKMWTIGEVQLNSRLLLGTAQYPSPQSMCDAVKIAGVEVVTVSLRRQLPIQGKNYFWNYCNLYLVIYYQILRVVIQ